MPIDLIKYANEQAKKSSTKSDSTTTPSTSSTKVSVNSIDTSKLAKVNTGGIEGNFKPTAKFKYTDPKTGVSMFVNRNTYYGLTGEMPKYQSDRLKKQDIENESHNFHLLAQKYEVEGLDKELYIKRNTEDDGVSSDGSPSDTDANAIQLNAATGVYTKKLRELGVNEDSQEFQAFKELEETARVRLDAALLASAQRSKVQKIFDKNYDPATGKYIFRSQDDIDRVETEQIAHEKTMGIFYNKKTDADGKTSYVPSQSTSDFLNLITKARTVSENDINEDGTTERKINPNFYFDSMSGQILSPKDWTRKNEDIVVRSSGNLNDYATDIEMEGGYEFSLWDMFTTYLFTPTRGLIKGENNLMQYETKAKDKKYAGWRNFRTTEDKLDTYYGAKFAAVNKHMINNLYRMSINNTDEYPKGEAKQKMVSLVQQFYDQGIITKEELSKIFNTDKVLIRNGTTISMQNIEQFDMSKFNDLLSSTFQKGGANLNMQFFENNKSYFLNPENSNSYFDNTEKGKEFYKEALNQLPYYKGQYDSYLQTTKNARKGATEYMISQFGTMNQPGSTEKYSESPAIINTIKDALVTKGNHIRTAEEAMQYLLDKYEKIEGKPIYSYQSFTPGTYLQPTIADIDSKYVLKDKKSGLASEINATPRELKSLVTQLRDKWLEAYNVSEEDAGKQIWQKLGAGLGASTFIGYDGIQVGGNSLKDRRLKRILDIANANFNQEANTNGKRVYVKDGGYDASVSIQAFSPEESNLYGGNPIKYRDDLEMKKELNDFIKSIPEDEFVSIDYSPVSSLKDFHAYVVRYGEDKNVKQKTIYLKKDAKDIDTEYFHQNAPEDFKVNLLHSSGSFDFSYLGKNSDRFANASKFFEGPLLYERDLENGGYKLTSKFYDYELDNYQKKSFPVPDFRTLTVDKIEQRIIDQIFAGINRGYTQVRGNK